MEEGFESFFVRTATKNVLKPRKREKGESIMDWKIFASVFSHRYGGSEMRAVMSEHSLRIAMRRVWDVGVWALWQMGVATQEEYEDVAKHVEDVDVLRSLEIEATNHHDVDAERTAFAEQCPIGGKWIHRGFTSADVTENAWAILIMKAIEIIRARLYNLLGLFAGRIEEVGDKRIVAMGATHLMRAQPMPIAYRFARYAQDMYVIFADLADFCFHTKGVRGAVGTSTDLTDLFGGDLEKVRKFQELVLQELELKDMCIVSQIASRDEDVCMMDLLERLATACMVFASDVRVSQRDFEVIEKFLPGQKGSSAMPHKKNPRLSERVAGLTIVVSGFAHMAREIARMTILERTLPESSARRVYLPEGFLAAEHVLIDVTDVLQGLFINEAAMARNLQLYGQFSVTSRVLEGLQQRGVARDKAYKMIQECTHTASNALARGEETGLANAVFEGANALLAGHSLAEFSRDEYNALLDPKSQVGDAFQRAGEFLELLTHGLEVRKHCKMTLVPVENL